MGVYGFLWVSHRFMGVHRCVWVSMDVYGCIWVRLGFFGSYEFLGCLLVSMGVYGGRGCFWVFGGDYGCCLWVFMDYGMFMGIYECI